MGSTTVEYCRVVVVGMVADMDVMVWCAARRSGASHVSFLAARHIFAGGKEGN
jgi:hypothetical protein